MMSTVLLIFVIHVKYLHLTVSLILTQQQNTPTSSHLPVHSIFYLSLITISINLSLSTVARQPTRETEIGFLWINYDHVTAPERAIPSRYVAPSITIYN